MRSRPGSIRRRRDSRGAVRRPTMRCLCTLVGLALLAALLPSGAATAEAWTSIYSGSETVTGPGVDDPNPVELGVRFTVSTPGYVSAIRYYKTSGNTGVHVGSLWTSHGRRLAKVTFSSETATGWQVALLAEPIPLLPGRTYVASYHTNTGRYAAEVGVFANGATIGNSTIRATSGVRRYGAGGFPLARKTAAYFVDVFFTPQSSASSGSDPTPSQSATPSATSTSTPTSTPTGTAVSATPTVGTSPTVVGASPTPAPTDTATPSTAPGALNLPRIPWEGGPNYWKSSPSRPQFAKADAAGWDDPSFFPISVFLANPGDAAALKALGVNLLMGVNHDVTDTRYSPRIAKATDPDRNPATDDGVFVMPHKEYEGPGEWTQAEVGNDPKAVAWFITDECDMGYSGCGNGEWDQYKELDVQTTRSNEVRNYSDGRFLHSNFGNGVARTFWSPDTMDEHTKLMDSSSVDKYAYTSPDVGGSGGVISGSKNWPKNAGAAVAATYGWMIDQMRLFQKAEPSPGDPAHDEPEGRRPSWAFVETAKPLLNESGARTITPDQMEGAVWSSIIHEARGVAYFPQNNDACGGYSLISVDSQIVDLLAAAPGTKRESCGYACQDSHASASYQYAVICLEFQ